jgi:hypothetical protein
MIRYIKIANDKKRDAEVTFRSFNPKPKIKLVLASGEAIVNKKVLKSSSVNSIKALLNKHSSKPEDARADLVADDLVAGDPEIDLELTGKFLDDVSRVYVNEQEKPVFRVRKIEKIYSPEAELKEEREPKYNECNITGDAVVNWTGKKMPIAKIYNKLVFNKKYQLKHINGLTYDFLFDMARQLSDSQSLMMLAGGKPGKEPLVLNDGGKPYRAFLEGRVKKDKYCLILHLTDQELKSLPKK